MSNPNPNTEQIKKYQYAAKLRPGDKEVMIDMIKSGTGTKAFIEFWTNEVGVTYRTAEAYYNRLKRKMI